MKSRDDRAVHRQRVDELLQQIDAQRRQQFLLEAAGMQAPGLERETAQTREQLAELVSNW
jgi:hypothetical protein